MTSFLPTTGSLSLSANIDILNGLSGLDIIEQPRPIRFSRYYNQDTDIPATGPLRFSDFRGAVDYQYNYLFQFDVNASKGQTSTIYWYNNNKIEKNPYKVVALSALGVSFELHTKGTTTDPTDTVVRTDATLSGNFTGWMGAGVGLWLQINNQTHTLQTRRVLTDTYTLVSPSLNDIVENISKNDTLIAPKLVKDSRGEFILDPYIDISDAPKNFSISKRFAFSQKGELALNQLIKYINSLSSTRTYVANFNNFYKYKRLTIDVYEYESGTFPLTHLLVRAVHSPKGSGYGTGTFNINLAKYLTQGGVSINLFMGPGPTAPVDGHIWGTMKCNMLIINNITLNFS